MNNPKPAVPQQTCHTMLQRLVEKVERANASQHSGSQFGPEDWAELYQLTNEARGMLAVPAFANPQAAHAKMLLTMKQAGLTFAECINVFGVSSDMDPYAKAAKAMAREGEIKVDDTTVLSGSDGEGDYVLCWMWVRNTDAGIASSPALDLEDLQAMGYTIGEDPDQPKKYCWRKDTDGSHISFASEDEAIASASANALAIYTISRCGSCGKAHTAETLVEIENYSTRVTSNGSVPSGQCPNCGALAYPIDSE